MQELGNRCQAPASMAAKKPSPQLDQLQQDPNPLTTAAGAASATPNMTRTVSLFSMECLGEVYSGLYFIYKEAEAEPREPR